MAKTVIDLVFFLANGQQTAIDQVLPGVTTLGEMRQGVFPALGSISQSKGFDGIVGQSALVV